MWLASLSFSALCSNIMFISEPSCNHHSEKCFYLYGNLLLHFFSTILIILIWPTMHCTYFIFFYGQSLLLNYKFLKDRNFCLFCSLLYFHYFKWPLGLGSQKLVVGWINGQYPCFYKLCYFEVLCIRFSLKEEYLCL